MQTTEKTNSTIIEVTFKAKRYDLTNGHLANEIDYSTQMTKVNSGCCGCSDENFNITIEPSGEDCPRIFVNHYDKSTKAEATKHN